MFRIETRTNVEHLLRDLVEMERQVPYVMATSLTLTAKDVQTAEAKLIADVVQNPTPYTLNSLRLYPATKSKLQARVWLRDGNRPEHYLLPLIEGGGRPLKRFEERLRMLGHMRADERAVPGTAVKLDAYGNMSRGQIVKILSQLKTDVVSGVNQNATESKRSRAKRAVSAYFVSGGPGTERMGHAGGLKGTARTRQTYAQHLPRGVWERRQLGWGTAVRPVLLFVKRTAYRKTFDFFGLAERVTADRFPVHAAIAVSRVNAAWFKRGGRG